MREKEAFAAAEWGSMIITGFITAYVLDMVVNFVISQAARQQVRLFALTRTRTRARARTLTLTRTRARTLTSSAATSGAVVDEAGKSPPPSPPAEGMPVVEGVDPSRRVRVLVGVLLGDFVHNLVDGLILGTAFGDKNCYKTMAWDDHRGDHLPRARPGDRRLLRADQPQPG